MAARWETIRVDRGPMRVYLDAAAGGGERPGVVVIMHGPGLDRFVEHQVEDLARHGYVAIAPDLYHRQPADGLDMMARIARLRDDEILADVDAAVAHLRALTEPRVGPLAVLGFCMGGRITYLLAGARPSLWQAAGVFYGGNIMKAWGDGPAPFDLTGKIACPVIGFFGAEDTNPSPADVARIDAELSRHGKPHEFHMYEGAGHAFLNFTNPERHRAKPAADAWPKMLAFLERHLTSGG
jgi:carboxymethylenebutenolidase